MTRLAAALLLITAVWCNAAVTSADPRPGSDSLPAMVFQYLDTPDADEAERLLRAIHNHPQTSIERVIRIIETERSYDSRPIGTLPDERIRLQGQT